jgi:TRAP-type C4-dicarboxylate transport system permease small subunit
MWSAAFIVPEREHVMFDLIWNSVSRPVRKLMRITGNLLVGGLALASVPATWDYVHFMAREGTPVLNLPFMWVFLPLVFLMVALTLRCAWAIWQALHGLGLDAELNLS